MALPPSEELSRWTINHVSNWLTKCSLSAFRSDFLCDRIDGSKLMRLTDQEVNQNYKHIAAKKRNILIAHLNKIESSCQPPAWSVAPHVPPRSGPNNTRMPPPPPVQNFEDSDSDGSWPEDFDDDDDDDDDRDDYLVPLDKALDTEPPLKKGYGTDRNHMFEGPEETYEVPEETYEIPEEDLEEIRQQPQRGVDRKPTMVDKLRDEVTMFKERNRELAAVAPPPRPPRGNRAGAGDSPIMERRHCAPPQPSSSPARHYNPPTHNILPPEDTYEVMNDVITETQKAQKTAQQSTGAEANHQFPRPARRGTMETPPEPQPAQRSAQKTRYAYSEVKKPGRLLPDQDELSGYEWYHGKIGREHAEKIFVREQKDGMFLIRKSDRNPQQPYTLVLWHCGRIWNIPIRKKDSGNYAAGKWKDGESEFVSVLEIVDHFKVVSLNLKSDCAIQGSHTLTTPAPKH